jgi:hypothetical protein
MIALLIFITSGFGLGACIGYPTDEPPGDELESFSLYLLMDEELDVTELEDAQVDDLELQEQPLITVDDIGFYDWSSHTFTMTDEAASRLPSPSVFGAPFVLVSQGERQYLGFFWTMVSSLICSHPVIFVDPPMDRCAYTIEAGYHDPEGGEGTDPRANQMIKEALARVGKLKSEISAADLNTLAGNVYILTITHIWDGSSGSPQFPSDELSECDYGAVDDGPQYEVRISEDGHQIEIVGHDFSEPIVGHRSEGTGQSVRFDLQLFAGGRFRIWIQGVKLTAELTAYGSGLPIISSERGELSEKP